MACDLQMTQANAIKWRCKTKVYQFDGHEDTYPVDFMIGFAGTADDIITAVEFFKNPDSFKSCPNIRGLTGLVLTVKKEIFMFQHIAKWITVNEPFSAIGTGSIAALGAMHSGATPREAVQAATKIDPFSGMGIKEFTF